MFHPKLFSLNSAITVQVGAAVGVGFTKTTTMKD
jgi:hypothetical protein